MKILSFILFLSSIAQVYGNATLECAVHDFKVIDYSNLEEISEGDKGFIEKNLKKTFVIAIGDEEVLVTSVSNSDSFSSSIDKYIVIGNDGDNIQAIQEFETILMNLMVGTISISVPKKRAWISLQSSLFSNSWILDCE